MEKNFLKKFEKKIVRIVLNNNFVYTDIVFTFNDDDLIQFQDRDGENIIVDPNFVRMISEKEALYDDAN